MTGHYKGGPGCGTLSAEKNLLRLGLYVCPNGKSRKCKGNRQFSCANWGCETISTIDNYKKQNDNHIKLIRGPKPSTCSPGSCNPLIITIKTGNPAGQHYWLTGQTWGIRLYQTRYDLGLYFTVQAKDLPRKPHPIGPNSPLQIPGPPQIPPAHKPEVTVSTNTGPAPTLASLIPRTFEQQPEPEEESITMLTKVHKVLNKTSPDIGQDCWLCLNPKPR